MNSTASLFVRIGVVLAVSSAPAGVVIGESRSVSTVHAHATVLADAHFKPLWGGIEEA
jgi:hypothetical protein